MKKLIWILLVVAATLLAADVKGTWKGQVNRPDGTKEENVILQLTQAGDAVSGKVGTNPDEMVALENPKLDGNKLTFEVTSSDAKFAIVLNVDGDSLKGGVVRTRDGQAGPTLPMELKRSGE